jgi:hypothetical protein
MSTCPYKSSNGSLALHNTAVVAVGTAKCSFPSRRTSTIANHSFIGHDREPATPSAHLHPTSFLAFHVAVPHTVRPEETTMMRARFESRLRHRLPLMSPWVSSGLPGRRRDGAFRASGRDEVLTATLTVWGMQQSSGSGNTPQVGRSRVQDPMGRNTFINLHNPSSRTRPWGLIRPLNINEYQKNKQTNSVALSPRANYTD